jgi:flagellar motor switch protein FliG
MQDSRPVTPFRTIVDPSSLPGRRKAAIIVQMCLAEGVKPPVDLLPEELQIELTRELGSLSLVDRHTLHSVAEEFANDLEGVGLAPPTGLDAALSAMGSHLSPTALARLRAEAARARGLDPWAALLALDPPDLAPILRAESVEVAAILLSKLPVPKAAATLGLLPGDLARRIAHAVSRTAQVSPEAVARIGRALAADYCGIPVPAFAHPPVERLGAILNQAQQATRDQLLDGLVDIDPDFAEGVRRAIFTFRHIPRRLRPVDMPRVLRGIDQAQLVTALAAATATGGEDGAAADFILANISQRLAETLREEMAERGRIKRQDAEEAMSAIVAAIRTAEQGGEITLVAIDEDDEDSSA